MRYSHLVFLLAVSACSMQPARTPDTATGAAQSMDSIVLERTFCFGTCPAYRLRVSSNAEVLFQSRNPGDSTVARDTVDASVPDSLYARAVSSGFFNLPDTVLNDAEVCGMAATDHPTIVINIYGPRTKHVVYYTGCSRPLVGMRDLAAMIDTLAQAQRWIQPAVR